MKNNKETVAVALVVAILGAIALVFVVNTLTTAENDQVVESVEPAKPKEPEEITVYATKAIWDRCKDVSRKLSLSEDQETIYSEGTKANVCVLDAIGNRNALVDTMRKKTTVVGKVYQTFWNGYTVYWSYEDGQITIRVDSNGQTVTKTVESGLDA